MAKVKSKAGEAGNVPRKHLHSRISFLYQAASYFAREQKSAQRSGRLLQVRNGSLKEDVIEEAEPVSSLEISVGGNLPEKQIPSQPAGMEPADGQLEGQTPTMFAPLTRHLLSQLRGVSLKSQIRLSPNVKHSVCKRCDMLLIPSSTSTTRVDNASRGGRKPWADVLVVQCSSCGTEKRFPVGAKRQFRKENRGLEQGDQEPQHVGAPVSDGNYEHEDRVNPHIKSQYSR